MSLAPDYLKELNIVAEKTHLISNGAQQIYFFAQGGQNAKAIEIARNIISAANEVIKAMGGYVEDNSYRTLADIKNMTIKDLGGEPMNFHKNNNGIDDGAGT